VRPNKLHSPPPARYNPRRVKHKNVTEDRPTEHHSEPWPLKHTLELATILLAIATIWLAVETHRIAVDTQESTRQQIGVQTWLEMEKRFDSSEMKQSRAALAAQFDHYDADKFDDSKEDVLDLFDDIGALDEEHLVDEKLTESTFSYYVNFWWEVARSRIAEDRRVSGDTTEYDHFEALAAKMHHKDLDITDNDKKDFLALEERLLAVTNNETTVKRTTRTAAPHK
jgi:hypothetical protein